MNRLTTCKVLVIGAAMTGLSFIGVATATAQVSESASVTRTDTNGSTSIQTSPEHRPTFPHNTYGPIVGIGSNNPAPALTLAD
jgi:hypothetical protein